MFLLWGCFYLFADSRTVEVVTTSQLATIITHLITLNKVVEADAACATTMQITSTSEVLVSTELNLSGEDLKVKTSIDSTT